MLSSIRRRRRSRLRSSKNVNKKSMNRRKRVSRDQSRRRRRQSRNKRGAANFAGGAANFAGRAANFAGRFVTGAQYEPTPDPPKDVLPGVVQEGVPALAPPQPVQEQRVPNNEITEFTIDREIGPSTCGTNFSDDNYHLNYIVMMPIDELSLEPLNKLFKVNPKDVNITIDSKFKFLDMDDSPGHYIICFSPQNDEDEYKSASVPKELLKLEQLGSFKELEEFNELNKILSAEIQTAKDKYSAKLTMLKGKIDVVKNGYEKIKAEIIKHYPLTPPPSPLR
jgi:hypothetical protein